MDNKRERKGSIRNYSGVRGEVSRSELSGRSEGNSNKIGEE